MLKLNAGGEPNPIFDQRELILKEAAEELSAQCFWHDYRRGSDAAIVVGRNQPVAKAPDHVLPRSNGKMVLKINIERIKALTNTIGILDEAVPINLQGHIRTLGKRVCPLCEQL